MSRLVFLDNEKRILDVTDRSPSLRSTSGSFSGSVPANWQKRILL